MELPPIPPETERVSKDVIGAGINVHRHLGPGFLEKIYQEALCLELDARKVPFERERPTAVHYRGIAIPGQRIDLIVAGCVIVELKAVTRIDLAHEAKVIANPSLCLLWSRQPSGRQRHQQPDPNAECLDVGVAVAPGETVVRHVQKTQ